MSIEAIKTLAGKDIATLTHAELVNEISRLLNDNTHLTNLTTRLQGEAVIHSMDARTANSTVAEIYQVITGARGEPGNWNGAEPVRKYVKAKEAEIDRLQRENAALKIDASNHAADAETVRREREVERRRAEAAEAEVTRLQTELALSKPLYSRRQIEARVELLEAALKPFAEYMGDHLDKDNHGNPLPDDLGVGWIYLKHADFRRARDTLASTGGEHHGN